MTMRRPSAFMARRSSTDRGRASAFMGAQFGQLSLPEVAMGQIGMRNDKVALGYLPGAKPDDVEIQGGGPPMLGPRPTLLPLDCLASLEQGSRLECGLQQNHL